MIDLLIDYLYIRLLRKTYKRRYIDLQNNYILNYLDKKNHPNNSVSTA